ncbi:MAG: threonylcarbamoyl-AMP synthase [Lachnospiraceae bacterium]|nr:threonylcarbamoyl-AMP synthase [Lachnospiraceae bacterium]
MDTVFLKTGTDEKENKERIERAGQCLKQGGLVAFPTETVYGLGADALNEAAAEKIYAAKGRPSDNPLIVHIADIEAVKKIAMEFPEKAQKLAKDFWPGPLTMILKKTDIVPLGTTGGLETVAIRMPSHSLALQIIKAAGGYVAAPSANTSGRPSPTLAKHVLEDMNGRIDMIVDGGEVGIGIESTIVDMSVEPPMILRPGYITEEMLEKSIGEVTTDPALLFLPEEKAPKAPGMKYKHYAPKGELKIVEGSKELVVEAINNFVLNELENKRKVGIIATDETMNLYKGGIVKSIGSRKDDRTIAKNLYAVLREFDEIGAESIYSESFEGGSMGQAIMNRLLKAAAHRVIDAEQI